jgi:hypothetical protein
MADNPRPRSNVETRPGNEGGFEKKGGYAGGQRPQNAAPQPKPTAFSTPVNKPSRQLTPEGSSNK